MEAYQIHQLEQMTGIKAHTIRIWEKRYGLISPNRTTTNRRYYDNDQVKKLLNVATLMSQGQKISKIAILSDEEINASIQNGSDHAGMDSIVTGYINDLVKSMILFDEAAFEKVCNAATTRFGMYNAMISVFYPFLEKVGTLWRVNKTAPAEEHFASFILRRKLLSAIDGLLPSTVTDRKFILFLPPGERHEIGLLFSDYIIRSKGYQTIYLGPDVPVENIEKIATAVMPTYLLLFYIAARQKEDIETQIRSFTSIDSKIQVLVAGNAGLLPENKSKIRNLTYLYEINSLLTLLDGRNR